MYKLKSKTNILSSSKGFTLVELLIVVVIIGILAGVVIAVIQPAKQQRRASEGVLQANADKMCLSLFACAATTTDAMKCDTDAELGVSIPSGTPTSSTYVISPAATAGATVTVTSTLPGSPSSLGGSPGINGSACVATCGYNFTTGSPVTYGTTTFQLVGCLIN